MQVINNLPIAVRESLLITFNPLPKPPLDGLKYITAIRSMSLKLYFISFKPKLHTVTEKTEFQSAVLNLPLTMLLQATIFEIGLS